MSSSSPRCRNISDTSALVLPVVEEDQDTVEGENGAQIPIPIDYNGPNPNGTEYDNLYLDMNGIVHPCTHPEGRAAPETEEDMMREIFKYTERVVNMVRPRKLLMMAIGVFSFVPLVRIQLTTEPHTRWRRS